MHLAVARAVANNLELADKVKPREAGSASVNVVFDGTWGEQRGLKESLAFLSVETRICIGIDVSSNYYQNHGTHKAFESKEIEQIWQAFHLPVFERSRRTPTTV